VGTSYSAAVNAGGTFVSFSDRILDSTGLTHAAWSGGAWSGLFHPDGHRLFRIFRGNAAINVTDLSTFTDLDDFTVPATLNGPAVMDAAGATLFAIASSGLLVLPLTPNRPPALEPIGPFVVPAGRSGSTRVIARDPDGNPVTLSTGPLPANATFDPSTGVLTFSPVAAQAGQDYVVFVHASDGSLTTMSRADLVVPAAGSPAITLIPISGALGKLSFDSIRNRLYAANSDRNRIETLDLGTLGRLAPIPVGDYPVGIDVNLPASRLVVCPFGSEFIEVVDLTAVPPARVLQAAIPNTSPLSFRRPWETGVAANGEALFGSKYPGTGPTAVWDLTLSSGVVAVRSDVPDANSQVWSPVNFATSKDRLRIFLGGGSASSGSMHRYDSPTNGFLARVDTNRFFDQLSTNQDGSRLALTTTPGSISPARVYDGSVVFLGQVSQNSGSSAFSPNSGRLYWTSRVTSELVASETTGFTDLFRITLPAPPLGITWPNSGAIAVKPTGDRVFVIVQGGIAIVEVTP